MIYEQWLLCDFAQFLKSRGWNEHKLKNMFFAVQELNKIKGDKQK